MSLISDADIETIVSRAVGKAQIVRHSLEPFSKTKTGFMGSHHQLTVEVKDKSDARKYTFFFKSYLEQNSVSDSKFEKSAFVEEERFYEKVRPLMLQNYRGEKWSAECYLVKPGVLIFEDLRNQGYIHVDDFVLGEPFVGSVVISLARFHACSLLAEAKLGKTLKEAFPEYFEEKMFSKDFKFWKSNEVSLETTIQMAKELGLNPSIMPKIFEHICKIVGHEDGNVNVVNHGDLWKNNLMFTSGESPKCLIIDYQVLRYTSFACDLSMILQMGADPEIRKEKEMEWFDLYYAMFREALEQSDVEIQIPSHERMFKEYEDHRIFGLWLACNHAPLHCYTPEEVMEMMSIPGGIDSWLYGDRFSYYKSHLSTKPSYAKMMKTLLSDLLHEGKRIL